MQWGLGVIGWSPQQFWSATPNELQQAINGWKAVNGVEERTKSGARILSAQEVQELKEMMEENDG